MKTRFLAILAGAALLAGCAAAPPAGHAELLKRMLTPDLSPGAEIDEIRSSPISGLLEVRVGRQILYATEDGKYIVTGQIFERESKTNLTQASEADVSAGLLASVDKSRAHTYAPKGPTKGAVFVFTDPSCPYCQRFHDEVPALVEAGVEVVYLGFPREGLGGNADRLLSGAFCAENKDAEFDAIMGDAPIAKEAGCLSPVSYHLDIAQRLHVQGTPAIFAADGRQLGGFLTAAQLVDQL